MYIYTAQPKRGRARKRLGDTTSQVVSVGAGIGGKVAGSAVTSSLVSSGAIAGGGIAAGALTAGIGAGIAIVTSLILNAWNAHKLRAKNATSENAAVNSAVQAFDASLQGVFAAANSSDPTQNITAAQASTLCQQILQTFIQMMQQASTTQPGVAGFGTPCGTQLQNASNPCQGMVGGPKCDGHCTAGCCVLCGDITPTITQAMQVFASGGGSVQVCTVYGSHYGAVQRNGYTLTYTPPKLSSVASAVGSALGVSTDTSGNTTLAGIPLWMLAGGVGVAAYLFLRR